MSHEFKVGQEVAICYHYIPYAISTVKRIMKRFVELEDGSKWCPGWCTPYPRQDYPHSDIRPMTDDLKRELREIILRNYITSFKYTGSKNGGLPLESLQLIAAVINEECEKLGKE